MAAGLFQMFFKASLQVFIGGGFGHLGQRFHQLVFGAVKVLEFVMEQVV
jgi:hypothetical protein